MKQAEILQAIGQGTHKYVKEHAKYLAAFYSFIKKERGSFLSISTEPATLMFGRKTEEKQRHGEWETDISNTGEELPAEKFIFTTATGTYSAVVPTGNSFHSLIKETIGQSAPVIDIVEKPVIHSYQIEAPIADAITRAKVFTSKDDLRPAMTCVSIEIENNKVRVIATDAHRLFMSKAYGVIGPKKFTRYLIPADQIKKIPAVKDGSFEFTVYGDGSVSFLGTTYQMLESDRFPNWKVVVPEYKKRMIMDREDLISAIKQVIPYTNKSTTQVNMIVARGEINLTGQDVDFSFESGVRMAYTTKEMNDFLIGFNGKFLLTALGAFKNQWVSMYTDGNKNRAGLFSDGTDTVLIMPLMNINDVSDYQPQLDKPADGKADKAVRVFSEMVKWLSSSKDYVNIEFTGNDMVIKYAFVHGKRFVRSRKKFHLQEDILLPVKEAIRKEFELNRNKIILKAA